jgi:hypothetical protein
MSNRVCYLWLAMLTLVLPAASAAQSWEFIKEKNGVKIYTRKEAGKSLKSFKGVADIHAPAERVFGLLEDVNHTDWWDKNLSEIRVLLYEKDVRARYYLVYDLSWPVTDRDLCVEAKVTIDPVTGISKITAGPLPGVIPEQPERIRIREYHQTWTVEPVGREMSHVTLEGYVDPAGSIPDWIYNMVITDSPIIVISNVRQRVEKK